MQLVGLANATDVTRFGGKAVELARALAHGLPVPPGLALDAELAQAVAVSGDASSLLDRVGELGQHVAVRSSGIDEDGASASFAGQHKTRLNVSVADELAGAIADVWRSARSPAALSYRKRLGLETAAPKLAVVIQPMQHADVAGVLFTTNPTTGADERVIEAAWGLGESVVMGLVTPDLYRVARGGHLLEARLGVKDLAVRCAAAGGTEEVEPSADDAARACLSPDQLSELDALAARSEAAFGANRDLEWAYVGSELFLLQCRAVTR